MGQGGHFSRAQKCTDTKTQSEASGKTHPAISCTQTPRLQNGEKTNLDFLRADELNGSGQVGVSIMVPLPKLGSQLLRLSKTLMVWPQRPNTRKLIFFFFLTFKETFALPTSGSFFFVVTFPQMLKKEWNSPYQVNCAYAKLTSTPLSGHLDAINRPHKTKRLLCLALVGIRFHSAFFSKNFSIKMAKER